MISGYTIPWASSTIVACMRESRTDSEHTCPATSTFGTGTQSYVAQVYELLQQNTVPPFEKERVYFWQVFAVHVLIIGHHVSDWHTYMLGCLRCCCTPESAGCRTTPSERLQQAPTNDKVNHRIPASPRPQVFFHQIVKANVPKTVFFVGALPFLLSWRLRIYIQTGKYENISGKKIPVYRYTGTFYVIPGAC